MSLVSVFVAVPGDKNVIGICFVVIPCDKNVIGKLKGFMETDRQKL
jgi:hypothetical protein